MHEMGGSSAQVYDDYHDYDYDHNVDHDHDHDDCDDDDLLGGQLLVTDYLCFTPTCVFCVAMFVIMIMIILILITIVESSSERSDCGG